MEGNLTSYLSRTEKSDSPISTFYSELRKSKRDLFVFKDSYLVILQDREREFDRKNAVKPNKQDIEEMSGIIYTSGINFEEEVKNGHLKPYNEIYWFEKSVFNKKGINNFLEERLVILPGNITSSEEDNYR
jgi:hypothetical protein